MANAEQFFTRGWCKFARDPAMVRWIANALPHARETLHNPAQKEWLRYQGTWFAGVNALPNDSHGRLPDGPALAGAVIEFIADELGFSEIAWDRAQVSVCYPGYPKPMQGETEAQHNFRVRRDAAHVDGLLGKGEPKRRFLEETHAFILAIPMAQASPDVAPFVIWEGSQEIMREAFQSVLNGVPPEKWGEIDLTDIYVETRRTCFESCRRVEIHALPGEVYLAHRLSLHGVAPWADTATAGPDGRMICYFRPELANRQAWLAAP